MSKENKASVVPLALIRELCRQLKASKKLQICKVIRKLSRTSGEQNKKLEQHLRLFKQVSHIKLTKDIVVKEFKLEIPRSLQLEWDRAVTAVEGKKSSTNLNQVGSGDVEAAREDFIRAIKSAKHVKAACESLQVMKRAIKKDLKRKRKRSDRGQGERNIDCGLEGCAARFATEEAKRAHQYKRHAEKLEDSIEEELEHVSAEAAMKDSAVNGLKNHIEEHPFKAIEASRAPKKKKNRMGQRARRREAIKRQIAQHQDAMKQGLKPPPYQRIEIPRSKTKKEPNSSTAGVQNDEDIHPSWKAKREKSKITQTQFQGSKIKFED